jgi:hypothetical protein
VLCCACRQKLRGHKKTVEDLVFQPGSSSHLISVGDDAQVSYTLHVSTLLFWKNVTWNMESMLQDSRRTGDGRSPKAACVFALRLTHGFKRW